MSVIFDWNPAELDALLASCDRFERLDVLERTFPAGTRLLEAGCGVGRWVRWFADRGRSITGLEYSGAALAMTRRRWPDLDLVQGDCERAPFPDGTFDGVMAFGVVEHWPAGPAGPLADLLRVLKPGGRAFLSVPCLTAVRRLKRALWWDEITQAPRAALGRLLRGKPKPLSRFGRGYRFAVFPAWGEFYEYRMTPAEFRGEVARAGFDILEQLPLGGMDGVYHELNPFGMLVGWRDWEFHPRGPARALDRWLARRPFAHAHMQAIVARRPLAAAAPGAS